MDGIKVTFLLLLVSLMLCSIHASRLNHPSGRNRRVPSTYDGRPEGQDDSRGPGLHLKHLREDLMEKRASRLLRARVRRDSSEEHLLPPEEGEDEGESESELESESEGETAGAGPGGTAGSSAGSIQGSSLGSIQGSSLGSFQGSFQGSSQGSIQGSSLGSIQGSFQGSSQGSIQGSSLGSTQGSIQGSFQGSSLGSSLGSFQGSSLGSSLGSSRSRIRVDLALLEHGDTIKTSGAFSITSRPTWWMVLGAILMAFLVIIVE